MTQDFGLDGNWTCGVFIQTPTRTVVVSEDLGRTPIYKKIPGGRRRPVDKTREATAIREAFEETGIRISAEQLRLVKIDPRRDHIYYLYVAILPEEQVEEHYTIAKNGERVHVLTHAELAAQRNEFLPHHRALLEQKGLWPKELAS